MKENETVTSDFSEFGYREIEMARDLLTAYLDIPKSEDFLGEGIKMMFNKNSGNVFLTDEDFNVGMVEDGKLKQWFFCSECGQEGFELDCGHDKEVE